jgi:BirA family transcriptional regulator, biotin operon repressor / biotin---[acetyl-CoA-carboxylase] ligase
VSGSEASPRDPETSRFGEIRWLDEVDSTNRYAIDEARAGAADGLVVVADRQTAGRGRLGRAWEAPSGSSLLASVLLRTEPGTSGRYAVAMAVGVAMADAVVATTGVAARLKWPNDLLVEHRKLAGVLAEAAGDAVVAGIGVNLDWPAFPPDLPDATACNLEGGRPVTRAVLLADFLGRLDALLGDREQIAAEYRARLSTLGTRVRVERGGGDDLVGTAVDIDETGALVVADDGGMRSTVTVGDVVHLRAI